MKKILILTLCLFTTLLFGCAGRNSSANNANAQECEHDHSGEHTHHNEGGQHEAGHSHSEQCDGHDHATHNHGEPQCDGHDHDHAHDSYAAHSHEEAETVNPDEIVFPASQAARTDFEVQVVGRGAFAEVIKCGGKISASPGELSVVAAPMSGIVTPYDGRIIANTPVKKGQKLFRISSSGLASGDAVEIARINFEQAKANYERAQTLLEDKLVTQRDYLDAESAYLNAKAVYEPLSNSDGKGNVTIVAQEDGYISKMSVSAGDFVEMGQPLVTISGSRRMQLQALVSQRYYDRIGNIRDANFRTSKSDEYMTVSKLAGQLYAAGRMVSEGSSLIPVVFEFDGRSDLPDGAYVDVVLLGQSRNDVIAVPVTAITEQQGLYYVYVQLDEDCYSRREVTTGADDGLRIEILSGLNEGERLVTRGAVNVKMASASGAIPHGHTH